MTKCSLRELMSDDIMAGAPLELKCLLQPYSYGDASHGGGNECSDYIECKCTNYKECSIYKQHELVKIKEK